MKLITSKRLISISCVVLLAAILMLFVGSDFSTPRQKPMGREFQPDADYDRRIDGLIEATEDPVWKVRWDAVNELGKIKDQRAIPSLLKRALYDENPHPRWRSLWALKSVDPTGEQTIPLLKTDLHESKNSVAVKNAAVALSFYGCPESRLELMRALRDPDEYRRWEAVFCLKEVGNSEAATALIPLLNHENESSLKVRQEAVWTLGYIGEKEAAEVLLHLLKTDQSPQIRWRAAAALSRIGDGSHAIELEKILAMEEDEHVKTSLSRTIKTLNISFLPFVKVSNPYVHDNKYYIDHENHIVYTHAPLHLSTLSITFVNVTRREFVSKVFLFHDFLDEADDMIWLNPPIQTQGENKWIVIIGLDWFHGWCFRYGRRWIDSDVSIIYYIFCNFKGKRMF